MLCPDCDFEAATSKAMANHKRKAHPKQGPNGRAIEETLSELRRLGRLEKIDSALVQALRSMAEALDLMPFNSQMWREYREAIGGLTADDRDSGAIDELLDQLDGLPSEVRDSP